jgi:hypothetical protein
MIKTKRFGVNVIIRDDDISYFTEQQQLEHVHKPLLELGLPVNLALIPLVDSSQPFVKRKKYDKRYFSIEENKDLVDFIKQHNFEVLQHGLTHEIFQRYSKFIPEFKIRNSFELRRRAELGIKILTKAFSKTPRFFVPPWDTLSKEGYSVIAELFDGVLLNSMSHLRRGMVGKFLDFIPRHLPSNFVPSFLACRVRNRNYCIFRGKFLILEHKGLYISPELNIEALFSMFRSFSQKRCVVVIVIHHWLLLSNMELFNTWSKLLDYSLSNDQVNVISVSDLYKKLVRCSEDFSIRFKLEHCSLALKSRIR